MFGTLDAEETSHQTITNLSTAPVKCSRCTSLKAYNFHLIEASTKQNSLNTTIYVSLKISGSRSLSS